MARFIIKFAGAFMFLCRNIGYSTVYIAIDSLRGVKKPEKII